MGKTFIIPLLAIFLLSFAAAGNTVYYNQDSGDYVLYKEQISKTYYNEDDNYVVTHKIYAYYDNDNRYSTYDYRHHLPF